MTHGGPFDIYKQNAENYSPAATHFKIQVGWFCIISCLYVLFNTFFVTENIYVNIA